MFNELLNYYHSYNHSHHEDFVYVYPTVVETLEYLKIEVIFRMLRQIKSC
ncbi:MAG: hypothetical protein ACLRQF_03545 [Thomasclavelia ramosa]